MMQTHLPLPKRINNLRRQKVNQNNQANQGLYFNKFFNQWNNDYSETIKDYSTGQGHNKKTFNNGKTSWLLSQVHGAIRDNQQYETKTLASSNSRKSGNSDSLEKTIKSLKALVSAIDGDVREFTTTSPFITGMGLDHPVENGFLWHHTLGVPYLPGSSIKGMIRAWAEHWVAPDKNDKDIYEKYIEELWRLFGGPIYEEYEENGKKKKREIRPAAAGNIIVFDALPVSSVKLYVEVMTPHDDGWRIAERPKAKDAPSDWKSPVPIPFLAVEEGATFQFALAPRKGAETDDLENAWEYLENALDWIGAGAKTAIGFGRFMTDSEIAKRKEEDKKAKEEAEEEAKKQAEEKKRQNKERRENWVPAVGDVVSYRPDPSEPEEKRIIKNIEDNGDFVVILEDGSNEMPSDKNECKLWIDDG